MTTHKGQQLNRKAMKSTKSLMITKKMICPNMTTCKGQQLGQR